MSTLKRWWRRRYNNDKIFEISDQEKAGDEDGMDQKKHSNPFIR